MREKIRKKAEERGFALCYFVPAPNYTNSEISSNIHPNAAIEFPWAQCALLTIWAYAPYKKDERIPAYYINSNRAYHAAKDLCDELNTLGVRAERIELPIKTLLADNSIGARCKSSLIAIKNIGTRFVVQSMLIGCENEPIFPEKYSNDMEACGDCTACASACPVGAITEKGYSREHCMREHMESAVYPDWVYDVQVTHIGCELCQYACPRNANLKAEEPSGEIKAAFDLTKLASGDTRSARLLVGKNMTGGGKLQKEAEEFLKRMRKNRGGQKDN